MLTRSTRLPTKRKRPKMHADREDYRREFRSHRRYVKGFGCCVPGCLATEIEFAHIRDAANAGISIKPPDWFAVGLCRFHHQEQHDCGVWTFQDRHKIDLYDLAAQFVRESPDKQIRFVKKLWEMEQLPSAVAKPIESAPVKAAKPQQRSPE